MKTYWALAALALAIPTAAVSADPNATDRFSDKAYFDQQPPPSWWQLWGSASLGFEHYDDDERNDQIGVNGNGELIFKAPSGFNVKFSLSGSIFDPEYLYGSANLDLFFANSEFAVGAYGGGYSASEDLDSARIGVQAAKFFSHIDIGAFAQLSGYRDINPFYVTGAWIKAYASQNTLVGVQYRYDGSSGGGVNYNSVAVHAEHRFADTNLGAYAEAKRDWGSQDYKAWDVFGGVTLYLDGDNKTLQGYQRGANPFWWRCCW